MTTVQPSASLEHRLLGQTLAGKYELVEVQASGAFGTVFRANQYFCKQLCVPWPSRSRARAA